MKKDIGQLECGNIKYRLACVKGSKVSDFLMKKIPGPFSMDITHVPKISN